MSQVYIGDLCHVLPRRVMEEFQSPWARRPWYYSHGDDVCNQYLYSEMSEKDFNDFQTWLDTLTEEEHDNLDHIPTRQNCDNEDDLGYWPEEYRDGDKIESEQEFMFSMCETWNGDGLFHDQDGNTYGVDMGCLGVVFIEDEIRDECLRCDKAGLGKVFDLDDFYIDYGDPPAWCGIPQLTRDGNGTFHFGTEGPSRQVIIMTGPDPEEEEDEDE